MVLTTLLHACETWTIYSRHAKQLNHFHTGCLRRILRIEWQDKIPAQKSWDEPAFRASTPSCRKPNSGGQGIWYGCWIVGCQNRYFMANSPPENAHPEVRKRHIRTAWKCLSKTLAYVTIRGKYLARTALPGEQGLPMELTMQRPDVWMSGEETCCPWSPSRKHLYSRLRPAGKTVVLGSDSSATSALIAHSELRTE